MDGREYIRSIGAGVARLPDYANIRGTAEIYGASRESMLGKIALLYGMDEISLIGTDPPPEVVVRATEDRSAEAVFNHDALLLLGANMANMHRTGRELQRQESGMAGLLVADTTMGMTPRLMTTYVDSLRVTHDNRLVGYSHLVLDSAVKKVQQLQRQQGAIEDERVGKVVREVICNERARFNEIMLPHMAVLTVERDFPLRYAKVGRQLNMRVFVDNGGRPVPAWLEEATYRNNWLQRFYGFYTAADAFTAVQAWIENNQLPYVLVADPRHNEPSAPIDESTPSTNANFLLCSLVPGRNEVIPFRVRHKFQPEEKKRYHPGVVLVEAADIGLHSTDQCIVEEAGMKKLGHRSITRYGNILKHHLLVHGGKGYKNSAPPTKEIKQAYAALLGPAFEFFDTQVLPRMAQPTASPTASKRR